MKIIIQYIGNPKIDLIDLLVYYEVPLGQREEVKRNFEQLARSTITL